MRTSLLHRAVAQRCVAVAAFGTLAVAGASLWPTPAWAAAVISAAWLPGNGHWIDPRWRFSLPTAATYPDNGAAEFFNVAIGSSTVSGATVELGTVVQVDSLALRGSGNTLRLAGAGSALRLAQDDARPGSGVVTIGAGDSIMGAGFIGGAGGGAGTMSLTNRGRIVADSGTLMVNASGEVGSSPPQVLRNQGQMLAQGPGSNLLVRNTAVVQGRGSVGTSAGGNVVLEDALVQGGSVRVAPCPTPLVCGELQLNRGAVVQGTRLSVEDGGVVRVVGSAFPGGTLPANMALHGGSVLVESSPLNPVVLTLDSGAALNAQRLDFSNPANPANPGRIVTNWPAGLPVEGSSVIRLAQGDVTLVNATFPGGNAPRGGIFLNGAVPAAAVIDSDAAPGSFRTLTIGRGTILTNMPGRWGEVGSGGVQVSVAADGLLASNAGGGLEIARLANAGGQVLVQGGSRLSVTGAAFDNAAEVRVLPGGLLGVAGTFRQTDGSTQVDPGGVLRAAEVDLAGGRLRGEVQSYFVLDGTWTLDWQDLFNADHVTVLDNPDTPATEGAARIDDGSRLALQVLFDALLGDHVDVLIADAIDVKLAGLLVDDPFADARFVRAELVDFFDAALGRERQALRLVVDVPEPAAGWLIAAALGALACTLARRRAGGETSRPVIPPANLRSARP